MVLHPRAHPARLSQRSEPPQVNSVRSRYPLHPPKAKTSLRSEGQISHSLTSSRTTPLQTFRPNRRDHRANRNSHRSRRRCSRLRMDRNHPPVKSPLPNNLGLSRLRSSVILRDRDHSRSFNSSSNRFNHSSSHRSLVNSSHKTNNPCNRRRERIRSQIWPACSSLS